eukprot:GEMP01036969.1.p1 GENE.GEMP01036969.1~~GEMP01036969.1.p1  ORF type:complete len:565 (+),score=100.31 GEMP01036969.1:113-1807(+)
MFRRRCCQTVHLCGVTLPLVKLSGKDLQCDERQAAPPEKRRSRSPFASSADSRNFTFQTPSFPNYSSDDIVLRMQTSKDVWVTHGDGVYDVTNFVDRHPGGDLILAARGGPLEPLWATYRVHFNAAAQQTLESMRIGTLRKEDMQRYSDVAEPFSNEPVRNPKLLVLQERPFDAETPKSVLGREFFVPNDLFYVRNHFPVPDIDERQYTLSVSLPDEWDAHTQLKTFRLEDLAAFPQVDICAYLSCAGTRSREVTKLQSDSEVGQMGNALWSGVRLRDVLLSLGVCEERIFNSDVSKWHVHFEGEDSYHMSIPLELALRIDRNVLLALKMNGEELPRDHGYPCRAIVPGCIGARSVKWISNISISNQESTSPWHQRIYRIRSQDMLLDDQNGGELDSSCQSCMEWPINSVILEPSGGDSVVFPFIMRGVALPSGGRNIAKVEISFDRKQWLQATLLPNHAPWGRQWAWSRWYCEISEEMVKQAGCSKHEYLRIYCRAVDESASTQSRVKVEDYRGLMCNTYHYVAVRRPTPLTAMPEEPSWQPLSKSQSQPACVCRAGGYDQVP